MTSTKSAVDRVAPVEGWYSAKTTSSCPSSRSRFARRAASTVSVMATLNDAGEHPVRASAAVSVVVSVVVSALASGAACRARRETVWIACCNLDNGEVPGIRDPGLRDVTSFDAVAAASGEATSWCWLLRSGRDPVTGADPATGISWLLTLPAR